MRVTFHAVNRLRDRAGLHDWSRRDIVDRIYHAVSAALRVGRYEPWRLGADAVVFEVRGRRYVAVVADDEHCPGGLAVVTIFERFEQAARVAAEGDAT